MNLALVRIVSEPDVLAWTSLAINGAPVVLSAASLKFCEFLSLDPHFLVYLPDVTRVDRGLALPIIDLMTVYNDLRLTLQAGKLNQAGDHFYVKRGAPNLWAGTGRVLVGEDAMDFDVTLEEVNTADKKAVIVVRHVPPAELQIRPPAEWISAPVGDTPNNWVEVSRTEDGRYVAGVGPETMMSRSSSAWLTERSFPRAW